MSNVSNGDVFVLNIFERAVQDPCCEDCDCEDEDYYQREEQSDEEHDPLEETGGCSRSSVGACTKAASVGGHSCNNTLVRHRSSPATATMASRPGRSRANSATLIRQISRQSAAETLTPAELSIEEGQRMEFSPAAAAQPAQVQRAKSSCSCIPTHLYGLEKYVSSALDALSTGDYESPSASGQSSSIISSPFLSESSSFSNPHSNSSLNSLTHSTAFRPNPKKARKKSFIEMSLAKSFSQ